MIDLTRAVFRRNCPWCNDQPVSWYDRLIVNRLPWWAFRLELKLNRVWVLGRWWHRRFHEPTEKPGPRP